MSKKDGQPPFSKRHLIDEPNVYFNLSHSEEIVICAICGLDSTRFATKEVVIVPEARHLCSAYEEPERYRRKLLHFFTKYDSNLPVS